MVTRKTSCRRILLLAITVLLAAPAIALAQSAVLPGVAEARCAGVGNPLGSTLEPFGLWVSEAPASGTCNNNGGYWCGWGTSATDSFTHTIRGTNTGF